MENQTLMRMFTNFVRFIGQVTVNRPGPGSGSWVTEWAAEVGLVVGYGPSEIIDGENQGPLPNIVHIHLISGGLADVVKFHLTTLDGAPVPGVDPITGLLGGGLIGKTVDHGVLHLMRQVLEDGVPVDQLRVLAGGSP